MNIEERRDFALKNPCHHEDPAEKRFEFRHRFEFGTFLAELKVINYFGMMSWIAAAAPLDASGAQLPADKLTPKQTSDVKKFLRELIRGAGAGEIHEAVAPEMIMVVRELSKDELRRMPPPPYAEFLNVKQRQSYALSRPVGSLETMLTGEYKLVTEFGGTVYSTMLTVDPVQSCWHASVAVLENSVPKTCYTIRATEYERGMEMMIALLDGVGAGQNWTIKPEKTGTAFHLYRKLSADELRRLPASLELRATSH
jgi:hypothetical protein